MNYCGYRAVMPTHITSYEVFLPPQIESEYKQASRSNLNLQEIWKREEQVKWHHKEADKSTKWDILQDNWPSFYNKSMSGENEGTGRLP